MDLLPSTPKEGQVTKCIYCSTTDSTFLMCKGYHFVCQECQNDFRTCPICFGDYLPFDDVLMETVVQPVNDKKGLNKMNVNINEGQFLVSSATYSERKKSINKCRDNFFMSVWDAVTSSLFSPRRDVSFGQFLGQTVAKIAKRMGKSLLNVASTNNKESSIVPISIGLLLLLVASQMVVRKGPISLRGGESGSGQGLVTKVSAK